MESLASVLARIDSRKPVWTLGEWINHIGTPIYCRFPDGIAVTIMGKVDKAIEIFIADETAVKSVYGSSKIYERVYEYRCTSGSVDEQILSQYYNRIVKTLLEAVNRELAPNSDSPAYKKFFK